MDLCRVSTVSQSSPPHTSKEGDRQPSIEGLTVASKTPSKGLFVSLS